MLSLYIGVSMGKVKSGIEVVFTDCLSPFRLPKQNCLG